ncbi:MAG: asparagine synthase C-terminal domain-containing protein [Candidatus Odinarchaeota archaeon]
MKNGTLEAESQKLRGLLTKAISASFKSTDTIGLLFSGGLDSSLLAVLLSNIHSEPIPLFVTGVESAKDIILAREVARFLKLPLTIRFFAVDEVREKLPEILSIISEVDVLQVELAIPLFFVTECAKQFNITTLFTGQGADELFGGYARHEQQFLQSGERASLKEMEKDFAKLLEVILPSQIAVVHHFGINLATPYLNGTLVEFSHQLPFSCKLSKSSQGVIRKRLLRELAYKLGIPPQFAYASKRAFQYGSGTHRVLVDLATEYWSQKNPGLSKREAGTHSRINEYLLQTKTGL